MTFPMPDRYSDLVRSIVGGSFYNNTGVVVPYSSLPTPFRFETASANTVFGIYVNELYKGTRTTDSQGNLVFSIDLPLGEVDLVLYNSSTGQQVITYVTVRDYAVWLSSYSDSLEEIDENIIQVRENLSIDTADLETLINAYGSAFSLYPDSGQGIEAYRKQVSELRSAYRMFGGKFKGLDEAVGITTQVPPFGYSRRKWGPNWVLDQTMLVNHRFLDRSHKLNRSSSLVTGVDLVRAEPDVLGNSTVHTLSYASSTNELTWSPGGSAGPAVEAVDGSLFLPGPPSSDKAFVLGKSTHTGPFNIVVGVNNKLYLNVDNLGTLQVILTSGAARTVANIVTDINTASFADPRYFSIIAASYNGKVLVESSAGGSVEIEHGPDNAAFTVFGDLPGDFILPTTEGAVIAGVSLVSVSSFSTTSISLDDTPIISVLTSPLRATWAADGVTSGAATLLPSSGNYSVTDGSGNILNIDVNVDNIVPSSSVSFTLGFNRYNEAVQQTKGLWVSVDTSLLPGSNQSDNITLYDDTDDGFDETPDYWFLSNPTTITAVTEFKPSLISNDKLDYLDPTEAFSYRITSTTEATIDLTAHVEKFPLIYNTPRGSNYPQKGPGCFYDYEGFTAIFSGWFKSLDSATPTIRLDFSFDGGDNWVLGTPVATIADTLALGYEDSVFVKEEVIIPADILYRETPALTWEDSGVLVRVHLAEAGLNINVLMESLSVEVKYISSRYLTNATVARTRHSQYFGELLYVWSPEALTIKDKEYLGIQHHTAYPSSHFGAVTITLVSPDSPAGNGTLEYEYNSSGPQKRLRWTANGTSWGAGLGWVGITADGNYTLEASDGSYIDVYVTYDILPTLTGTSPVTSSRTVLISDTTLKPGLPRSIFTAHSDLDILDVTEYDSNGDPINLKGFIDEGEFATCNYINVEINSEVVSPTKYSYFEPDFGPQTGEELALSLVGINYEATLDYYSDEDQTSTTLYEDGVPVPNDLWSFSAADTIQIPQANFLSGDLSLSSTLTVDYELLYQVETNIIDLGTSYQDYMWLVDYLLWDRFDKVEGEYETTTPLFFTIDTGRASLVNRSAMNYATANLYVQQATERRVIPKRYWRFEDDQTVSIDIGVLVKGQYYLEHKEVRVYPESRLTVTFEHKSATSSGGLTSATYSEVERNENIHVHQSTGHRFHQLRLSISGVRDLRDFRIRSLVMKGLKLHGSSPSVEGLTNVWSV